GMGRPCLSVLVLCGGRRRRLDRHRSGRCRGDAVGRRGAIFFHPAGMELRYRAGGCAIHRRLHPLCRHELGVELAAQAHGRGAAAGTRHPRRHCRAAHRRAGPRKCRPHGRNRRTARCGRGIATQRDAACARPKVEPNGELDPATREQRDALVGRAVRDIRNRSRGGNPVIGAVSRQGTSRRPRPLRCGDGDRKSTRLNSSHVKISYAVFCLKKKKKKKTKPTKTKKKKKIKTNIKNKTKHKHNEKKLKRKMSVTVITLSHTA